MTGVIPFSKGSFRVGQQISAYLRRTSKTYKVPLFSMIFSLHTIEARGAHGTYWTPQFSVPEDEQRFVKDIDELNRLRDLYIAINNQYRDQMASNANSTIGQSVEVDADIKTPF